MFNACLIDDKSCITQDVFLLNWSNWQYNLLGEIATYIIWFALIKGSTLWDSINLLSTQICFTNQCYYDFNCVYFCFHRMTYKLSRYCCALLLDVCFNFPADLWIRCSKLCYSNKMVLIIKIKMPLSFT